MDDCIDTLGEAAVFSTIDNISAYWQVGVEEADRGYTAFTSHHGQYRFVQMPFG